MYEVLFIKSVSTNMATVRSAEFISDKYNEQNMCMRTQKTKLPERKKKYVTFFYNFKQQT